jgi:serine/threonine protein kinase
MHRDRCVDQSDRIWAFDDPPAVRSGILAARGVRLVVVRPSRADATMPPSPADPRTVRALFAEAMDAGGLTRVRDGWFDTHHPQTPPGVRAAVLSLLEAHEAATAGNFLKDPTLAMQPDAPTLGQLPGLSIPAARRAVPTGGMADATEQMPRAGDMIGPYRIVRELGRGGFGTVFQAEQQHPVRRPVAIKLINPGMDTRQVVARFRAERQALALMSHPNIARVLDAGATERGRPYFVMELVEGRPLTDYCRRAGLAVADRLQLFLQVCRAVQHAHQKGVVHRDLKPHNVLVAEHDGRAVPKVIDFGVAKALHGGPADGGAAVTAATEAGQVVGTPQYMSPEQASPRGEVDTRTDVYGLGVMLYELLTGLPPFDPERLRSAPLSELERIIREEEPVPPSQRVFDHPPDAADQLPEPRHRLSKKLSGDLDWIVLRAIEKDPARRYATADAVAEDIQRHLSDEPVEAGPPGVTYRVRKFAWRNRGLLTAGAAVTAALLAGLVGTTVFLFRAEDALHSAQAAQRGEAEQRRVAENERQRALANETRALASAAQARSNQQRAEQGEKAAREALARLTNSEATIRAAEQRAADAQRQAQTARQQADDEARRVLTSQEFFHALLFPRGESAKTDAPPAELLAFLARRLDAGVLNGSPELEAPLRMGLGLAFDRAGDFAAAESAFARYVALHAESPDRLPAYRLATAHHNLGVYAAARNDWPAAERSYRQAIAAGASTAELKSRPVLAMVTRRLLAEALLRQRRPAEAVEELGICASLLRGANDINEHEAEEARSLLALCGTLAAQGAAAADADRLTRQITDALAAQTARGVRPATVLPYRP